MPEQENPNVRQDTSDSGLLGLTADIVAAFVNNNHVAISEMSALIEQVGSSLRAISTQQIAEPQVELTPAVPIRRSVQPDYILCLEDGHKVKTLKRYIQRRYGLSPQEYRTKWGLPADYPMVAPNYSRIRSELARNLGLGRKGKNVAKVQSQPETTSTNAKQRKPRAAKQSKQSKTVETANSGTAALGVAKASNPRGGKSRRTRAAA